MIRVWLVLGTSCALLCACSPAPQVNRTTPTPPASATPSAASANLPGGWSAGGDLSTQRGGQMVGVILGGGRLLVTGTSSNGLGIGNVDLYDPATGWTVGPKLSSDLPGAAAAPLPDGRALVAGGVPWQGGTDSPIPPVATAMTYNPATRTWTKVASMSVARSDATASALPDGRVLVAGGRTGTQSSPLGSTQFFNPASSGWTTGPALAHPRFAHSALLLKGGRLLVVGGADQMYPARILNSAEVFDATGGRWLSAGTLGDPRTQFTLTTLADGRALLAGGLASDGATILRSTLLYDPVTNQWSAGPDLANARASHAAAVLPDGRVLVSGGVDQVGRLASSELFDPSTNSWSATGALTTARSNHLAISLPNGRILVVAGSGSADALASSELFDLSARGRPAGPRAPAGPGLWVLGASKPIPVDSYTGSAQLLPDGRVLVVPRYGSADFEVYDPKSDAWTTPFSRKAPPCNACGIGSPSPPVFLAAPLGGAKVLLLTVDPQQVIAAKAEVIDLNTGVARLATSPGKIGQSRLDLLPDGRIWVTALQGSDRHALLYDATTDRWVSASDVPLGLVETGGDLQTVTAITGKRVLVVGHEKAMVYDPVSGIWTDAGSFPNLWSQFSATGLVSGDVLFAGGMVQEGTTPEGAPIMAVNSQVMRWDHTTGKLQPGESMPVGHYFHSAALLADGRVLVAGGSDMVGVHTSADPVTRAEIYDPVSRTWSAAAPLPVARYQAIAVTLPDGRVLLVGGSGMWLGALEPSQRQPSLLFTPGL